MNPAYGDNIVLYSPLPHPERVAAGMADPSNCELDVDGSELGHTIARLLRTASFFAFGLTGFLVGVVAVALALA